MADIWLVDLSGSRGHEQKKKRPGIVWRDLDHVGMAIVIPCTTKTERTKLPHTHLLTTSFDGFDEDSIALIFQITTIDKKRLIKKIGKLKDEDIQSISSILRNMLKV